MAAKYFVWGEGVWREVDVASGRVSGWRHHARFVFVRHGRLLVARRRPVLRALEALAAGQPSAAADGPRLSHRSKSESRSKRKHVTPAVLATPLAPSVSTVSTELPGAPPPPACHHHCCAQRCNNNDERPAGKRHRATQCAPGGAGPSALTFNVNQKHKTTAAAAPDYSSAEEFVSTNAGRPSLAAHTTTEVKALFGKAPTTELPTAAADKKRTPVSSHPADKSGDERQERAKKRPRTIVSDDTDSTSADEPLQRSATTARPTPAACKELIISDEDVALLRGYVSRTNASALQRFDADDAYKCLLFYAINPLVSLERCARLECLLRTRSMGLAPARPRARPAPRSVSADTDKENKDKHSSPNKVLEPVSAAKKLPEERPAAKEPAPTSRNSASRLGVSERSNKLEKDGAVIQASKTNGVASDRPREKPERSKKKADIPRAAGHSTAAGSVAVRAPAGTHVISKRASQPAAKEYSNLEDHAIVAWVSAGSRACLVGGNRVWRELQDAYERLTGRARSWHSLRNRYLRYILPALGALRLPPADVARLRAAAATGAIKTKNRLAARRHSLFQEPARGASSRRPREGAFTDDTHAKAENDANGPSSPNRPSLRSRPPESASYRDESGNESASKASGSKELNSQASISKNSGSKAGGSKEVNSKASGSKESGSKAGSSKASGSKAGSSMEVNSKASGSKEFSSKESVSKTASRTARSPRYSEVTRRFAARHRPTPSSSSSSPSPPPSSRSSSPVLEPPKRSRRLFNPNTNV